LLLSGLGYRNSKNQVGIMLKFTFIFIVAFSSLVLPSTKVFANSLNKCISNYCSYSCSAVASCGYQAKSQVPGCKRSCKPSAKASFNRVKKSKRLKTCRNSNSTFHKLTCSQIGSLLGTGGGGNTKKSYLLDPFGAKLGALYIGE
jgi:hypothetical protein